MINLTGHVALVTGAGSERGIGQAIAQALAAQGASVAVADLDGIGAERVATLIRDAGRQARAYTLDVTDPRSVQSTVAQVVSDLGSLEILVNNAGISQPITVEETTRDDWDRVMAVNSTGTFLCSQAAAAYMGKHRYGRIINMSSVSAKRGGGVFGGAHYSAAKAAVLGFGKAMAREVAPFGITVNSVTPGLILTDIRGGAEPEDKQREMSREIPLQRVGLPEEVAALVCFLASTEAGYITGEEIDINGGSHID